MPAEEKMKRLDIFRLRAAGCRIPDMPDTNRSGKPLEVGITEHFRHQPVSFLLLYRSSVPDKYSRTLLPAMLQCMEEMVENWCCRCCIGCPGDSAHTEIFAKAGYTFNRLRGRYIPYAGLNTT